MKKQYSWKKDSWMSPKKPCVFQDPRAMSSDPEGERVRLAYKYPGVSRGSMGQVDCCGFRGTKCNNPGATVDWHKFF